MRISFMMLAEFASAPPDGKLYIIGGGVHRVGASAFPVQLGGLSIIAQVEVPDSECGQDLNVEFRFLTADGKAVVAPTALTVRAEPNLDGPLYPSFVNIVMNVVGLTLPSPGDYAFSLLRGDVELGSLPFHAVIQTPPGG